MTTKELAQKLREAGERARYSTEPGRVVQEVCNLLAEATDPPEEKPADAPALTVV